MILIPNSPSDRRSMVEWFIDDMNRGRQTARDGDALLSQLRLAGDVVNLERLSRVIATRGRA